MQIERLRLINFRQHEDTELVLGAGLTGIIGPNGAGKTTLLEAIAWAMYGAPAARGSRETIRRRGSGARSPVRVELEFVLGAHRYRIERTLNSAELYQDGEAEPVANSLGAVTDKVGRLLGMTREEFFNTYFTGQKELAVMAAMNATERAQFLNRVLGYERLKTAQDRLRERRTGLRARLQTLESSLPDPAALDAEERRVAQRLAEAKGAAEAAQSALNEAERKAGEEVPRWEAMQRLQESVRVMEQEFRLAEHRVASARERFSDLDRQLLEANEAKSHLDALQPRLAPLEALRAERRALDAQAGVHAARQADLAQLDEVKSRLAELDTQLAALPSPDLVDQARRKREELRTARTQLEAQAGERRTAWVRDLQDAKTKRGTLLEQYQELKKQHVQIQEAGPDGVCPTCARPLGAEFENVLGILDRQLEDVRFNGQFYKNRIEQLTTEPADLRELTHRREQLDREIEAAAREVTRLEDRILEGPRLMLRRNEHATRREGLEKRLVESKDSYDPARHRQIVAELEELEPLGNTAERYRAGAERAEALVREAEVAERLLSDLETASRELRHRLQTAGYSEAEYIAAREAHEAVDRERQAAERALLRARTEAEVAEEQGRAVARRREERKAMEAEAARTKLELEVHNELDRALTDLRTDLNEQLRPDLSELASSFLRVLTDGRYTELELDENYLATLLDDGEVKPVISGGEEDVANLALRLAISQMIADRAGQPLSLLVLDEVFGSLDEERRSAVVDLLRSLADRFPQVILITHIESVREGMDRVLRVEYDLERGSARVVEEPGEASGVAA